MCTLIPSVLSPISGSVVQYVNYSISWNWHNHTMVIVTQKVIEREKKSADDQSVSLFI